MELDKNNGDRVSDVNIAWTMANLDELLIGVKNNVFKTEDAQALLFSGAREYIRALPLKDDRTNYYSLFSKLGYELN